MKLLFIANRFPYPPFRGDKLKIFNLAKQLSKSHTLHLITFVENQSDYQYVEHLKPYFEKIELIDLPKWKSVINVFFGLLGRNPLQVQYFKSSEFKTKLDIILNENTYDAIHVQHLRMAQFALHLNHPNRILDLPDAFSLYWERRKSIKRNFITRLLDNIESKKVLNYEKEILQNFNKCLVCSQEDLNYLRKKHQLDNLFLLPNGVDVAQFKFKNHDYTHTHTLLFTGNMDYAPNVDAVIYFVNDVFPIIKVSFPEVKFIIAGQRPIDKVLQLHNGKDVLVTGFVEDLTDLYNSASVVVAPLRFGAGTQNKVLEAMSMGIPVVCSNIGFDGLEIQDGEGAFMRTNSQDFANQVIALLSDSSLREKTGSLGTLKINQSFSWAQIAKRLEGYFMPKAN
jgi:sugar transferase (PEP-CTERM/EpsH1 system associated)